jgi:hypothetical protein
VSRKLLYSERKRLAETGSLGPLSDEPTPELRNALSHLFEEGLGRGNRIGPQFRAAINKIGFRYLGWVVGESLPHALISTTGEGFLDLVEAAVEEASRKRPISGGYSRAALPDVEAEVNNLFDRHRFGYRLESGEIRKVGSPTLDEIVIGPALLAVQRSGWEEVERSFREAIHHQRGAPSENDDALTAANAALESALKAVGISGDRLSALAKNFRNSDLVPSELRGVPEAIDTLLKRSGAIRDNHGDAHGKAADAEPVPQELVDLAIHWAGSFIVYLSRAASN